MIGTERHTGQTVSPQPMVTFHQQPSAIGPHSRSGRRTTREVWILRVLCATFLVCSIGLLAGLIVNRKQHEATEYELAKVKLEKNQHADSHTEPTNDHDTDVSVVRPPDYSDPDIFLSLSADEMKAVREFLYKEQELNLTRAENVTLTDNYIFMMEYLIPPKKKVLAYLNGKSSKPLRWAEVTIFRAADDPPVVQTLRVGPLPHVTCYDDISSYGKKKFHSRIEEAAEMSEVKNLFHRSFSPRIIEILQESFNATPTWLNCTNRCFSLGYVNIKRASEGRRVAWYRSIRHIQAYYYFPMLFNVEVDKSGLDTSQWSVQRIFYNGLMFQNLSDFEQSYTNDPSIRLQDHFDYESNNLFSTFRRRNNSRTMKRDRRPEPVQVNPGGHRFDVDGNRVSYMDWEFRYLVQPSNGLQLFDIRFNGQRIAYEISLQELVASYSGAEPSIAGTTFFDSGTSLGLQNFPLVPGVDCPHSSVMLDIFNYNSAGPIFHAKNALCIFEWNTQLPMKRHYANDWNGGYSFYGGQSDTVLVMRTILSVTNYDYVIDYMFHLNGAIEVRIAANGYIWVVPYYPDELKYGHRLRDNLFGPLHVHLFNFKIDMDINGRENCFETLDIAMDENTAAPFDANEQIPMMTFKHNLRRTESEALINYNFDEPKYLLFYNRDVNNAYGDPRAYRLHGAPYGKLLLPENAGKDPAIAWARHQVIVTKRKETEQRSSDIYSLFNFDDPVVNFTSFYADDESMEQEDLVAWITLGFHHLPHTEDFPATSTVGTKAHFMLLPHNYFDEDPSMVENNLVFIQLDENGKPKVDTYADNSAEICSTGVNLEEYDGKYYLND